MDEPPTVKSVIPAKIVDKVDGDARTNPSRNTQPTLVPANTSSGEPVRHGRDAQHGAHHAINLDGGSSTVRNNSVINRPTPPSGEDRTRGDRHHPDRRRVAVEHNALY